MCWRSPATTRSASAAPPVVSTSCSPRSRPGRGSACRPARAPKASGCTTGRLCAWTMPPHHPATRRAGAGSWFAATAPPASWPPTAVAWTSTRCAAGALVPLGHAGDARPCLPGRGRCPGAHPPPTTTRADRGHLQRSPAPVRRRGRPARWRPGAPTALVELAAPTSATRPYLPLPPTGSLEPVKITNYGWRTRRPSSRPEPDHQVPPPPTLG
jgi:hypothetical protein